MANGVNISNFFALTLENSPSQLIGNMTSGLVVARAPLSFLPSAFSLPVVPQFFFNV
jgi:hypothetical protein